MQGPGGGRRGPTLRQPSRTSFYGYRQGSIASSIYRYRAGSCRSQSTTSERTADKYIIRVFDEGKDVTPHPLFQPDPSTAALRQDKLSGATGSILLALFPTQQLSRTSLASLPWTYGSSTTSISNASMAESVLDETAEPGSRGDTTISCPDVQVRQEEIKEELTEADLDRRVDIYLTETETIWILDLPAVVMSTESEDAERVLERNKVYTDICKSKADNDRFVEKTMQTLNGATKNKEVQCDRIIMEDKGEMVTSWDFYDTFNALEIEPIFKTEGSTDSKTETATKTSSKPHTTKKQDQTTPVSSTKGSTTSMTSRSAAVAKNQEEEEKEQEEYQSEALPIPENLQKGLFFMERILMENIFQPKLAAYRQFPILIDPGVTSDSNGTEEDKKEAKQEKVDRQKDEQEAAFTDPSVLSALKEETAPVPTLEWLWSYACGLTNGHSVSSMAWSKVNPDLLAVGYGAFDFKGQKKGLACCWSLKNPMWPERIFQCEYGVTALDFSMASPNLLAVGMYDGSVTIYDVQSCNDTVLLDSSESPNKHRGPVWQLRWVEQDRGEAGGGKRERLFCISADGRITEWYIQKRLDCTDLMKIKRKGSEKKRLPGKKERKSEALISRQAAGMCFDFHPKDTNFYLAGTEEGCIYQCSCSSNGQFLKTYRGHKGPVYKVTWNPLSTEMFLSCSADWSIILWHRDSQTPVLTFSSASAFVHDIMWSSKSAFMFAAVNESRVEIWDLRVSILEPVLSRFANPTVKFTSVLFAKNTDCLLVGDSQGEVGVFLLQNLAALSNSKAEQASCLSSHKPPLRWKLSSERHWVVWELQTSPH
ncbi:dynein axonemal intermediate chain 4 isoform X1 [Pezoporus occidentalis]|uniref:dynein axonemal intermediate chain 4 isoform X1 n=2 Tax=Pezoporus occidentalis TaxID=407982 RepID=UPI002F91ACA5